MSKQLPPISREKLLGRFKEYMNILEAQEEQLGAVEKQLGELGISINALQEEIGDDLYFLEQETNWPLA